MPVFTASYPEFFLYKIARYWLLPAVLCLAPLASTQAATNLYSAEVTVPDQGKSARADGLRKALSKVIVRVSGDPDAALSSAGREIAGQARNLVQQFGYKRVPQSAAENSAQASADNQDNPPTDLRLQVSFNPAAVNNALRRADLPVWGSERPKTMLWLAVTGEGAPHLINGDLARPLEKIAEQRGLPIVLPGEDAEARKRANAADVIAGYDDRLRAVAQGHGASHLLIAKIRSNAGGWQGQWTLTHNGKTLDNWSDSASGETQLLADAMRRTADTYARRYAVAGGAASSTVIVAVDHLSSAHDFARVSNYLTGLTAVESAVPVLVNSDYVLFSVKLSGDANVLRRSIGLADWLHADGDATNLADVYDLNTAAVGYRISR